MRVGLKNSLFKNSPLRDVRYTFHVYEDDDKPPGYDRILPPTAIQGLTLFDRLFVRYLGELYIVVEEEDYRGEGMFSHPAKIKRFFNNDPAFNRQLSRVESKSDILLREKSLSRVESTSEIRPRSSSTPRELKEENGS